MQYKYNSYTLEQLQAAILSSFSIAQTLKVLGVIPSGGNYRIIKKKIAQANLDTSHFKGQGWSRGQKPGPRKDIERYLSNEIPIQSYKLKRRLIQEGIFQHQCSNCKLTDWLGKLIPLELDHINGNHEDNSLNNLRVLCPNCHSLTETYRGKKLRKPNPDNVSNSTRARREKFKQEFPDKLRNDRTHLRKVVRPSKEELHQLVWSMSTVKVAALFGVSDKSIEKWCKSYEIEKPPRGYWQKVVALTPKSN